MAVHDPTNHWCRHSHIWSAVHGYVVCGGIFSHQIGSFIGVWLGGYIHDLTGTYDAVWQTGIVLGIVAAVLHVPINENPLTRTATAPG